MEALFERLRKYNFWDGQQVNTGFERSEYHKKVVDTLETKLVKVLVGQRRTGKSYILRQIIKHLITEQNVKPKNIFYFNKEFIAFDGVSNAQHLEQLFGHYVDILKPEGKIYIFLDEIQNVDSWEHFVNSYSQDFTREYEIFITGSNSKLLSGELATLLSGRYVEFDILPFSYSEYSSFTKQSVGKESFLAYLQHGGLPELFHLGTEELKRNYIASLKNTIILRDIIERNNVKDIPLLEDIFNFLSTNIGCLSSISNIVNYFKNRQKKTNYETVSSYIEFLTNTFMFHRAGRYNLRSKKILGGSLKYYLNDLALKNFLFGFSPSDIGFNLENYVYVQLRRLGYSVSVGVLNNLEIDFYAQRADRILYVQVCYLLSSEKVLEREFGNLLKIKDNHEKIVISLDDIKFSNYEGIIHKFPWELS